MKEKYDNRRVIKAIQSANSFMLLIRVSNDELSPALQSAGLERLVDSCYAALLRLIRMPALVAREISISRLNFSHLPRMRSETRD